MYPFHFRVKIRTSNIALRGRRNACSEVTTDDNLFFQQYSLISNLIVVSGPAGFMVVVVLTTDDVTLHGRDSGATAHVAVGRTTPSLFQPLRVPRAERVTIQYQHARSTFCN